MAPQVLSREETPAAVLSDRKILVELQSGNIVIRPFNDRHLQSSSYDLTLGRYFYREQPPPKDGHQPLFNIYSAEDVEKVWGSKWQEAVAAKEMMEKSPAADWVNIRPDDEIILLAPGETILAHTQEFIGFRNVGTTMMKARSSLGRVFIETCKCAGWGDNGYINRWTMEITNNSNHYAIPLIVGTRVAQLVFFYTGETDRPYPATGSYQSTDSLEELERDWRPSLMLPRIKRPD